VKRDTSNQSWPGQGDFTDCPVIIDNDDEISNAVTKIIAPSQVMSGRYDLGFLRWVGRW
jgi:hypothetical protein